MTISNEEKRTYKTLSKEEKRIYNAEKQKRYLNTGNNRELNNKRVKARRIAVQLLIERHQREYHILYDAACKEMGLDD